MSDRLLKSVIGEKIAHARIKSGMTQKQLAEKMDITTEYLRWMENGSVELTIGDLRDVIRCTNAFALDLFPDPEDLEE